MDTLSDATSRYQARADASAFFKASIARGLEGTDRGALHALDGRLDRPHFLTLQKFYEMKSAVGSMDSTNDLAAPTAWASAFLAFVKAESAIDAIGGVPVPLNIFVARATATSTFSFYGEDLPAPVSKMATAVVTLAPFKIGGIRVYSRELALFSDPKAPAIIEADARRCLTIAGDRAAWDPDASASAGVNPASLTHGATEISASGSSGESFEVDARNLLAATSAGEPEKPRFVLNKRLGGYLGSLRTTTGQRAFPNLGVLGGEILGVPAVIGTGVPDVLICVDAAGVLLGDGGIEMTASKQATLQMSDAPGAAGQTRVSLMQDNLIGLKLTRFINWARRDDAVAFRRVTLGGSPE